MFFLAQPLFLYGLISIPALIGIYLWRQRARRYMVSSLILWQNLTPVRQGGKRFQRIHTPLLFFIELLILFLCVLAAADPMLSVAKMTRPLTVVLDDSVSMKARDNGISSQNRGLKEVQTLLQSDNYGPVRFIFAGLNPTVSPRTARSAVDVPVLLKKWQCNDPHADLEKALEMAVALGGRDELILVISDQAPPRTSLATNLKWKAVGKPLPNVGFVNAARTHTDGQDRCLLEIANFADQSVQSTLQIAGRQKSFQLEARETKRLIFDFPPDIPVLTAVLGDDSLAADNRVWLYPPPSPKCRVKVAIKNPDMRSLVENALQSARLSLTVEKQAELVFTDKRSMKSAQSGSQDRWIVHLPALTNGPVYQGPFVTDYTHPLMHGIAWEGVIWGAGLTPALPGAPVLAAGDTSLITDIRRPSGRHHIYMRINAERSDGLQSIWRTPAWPSLIWNLLQWRIDKLPGLKQANVRAGESVTFIPESDIAEIRLIAPNGRKSMVMVRQGVAHIRPRQTGQYILKADNQIVNFASNLLSTQESDLTQCRTGQWGDWHETAEVEQHSRPLTWVFLVLALLGLSVHLIASRNV